MKKYYVVTCNHHKEIISTSTHIILQRVRQCEQHNIRHLMKMNRYVWTILLLFCSLIHSNAQQTPFELKGKNYSASYTECINYYQSLDRKYNSITMQTMGATDAGLPLHVVLINAIGKNDPELWHQKNKVVVLINNGIHPGEPDGIDASMMLARDIAEQIEKDSFPSNIAIAIIPIYNIGGSLLRSPFHRPDQNGPESFGERGNSQNLDLNRDFIKCDSKEARSFTEIFHWLKPDIFMDTHVSDGADYQHIMTLATTQHNKLGGELGRYINQHFEPSLFNKMKEKGYPIIPYVNVWGKDARNGWTQFFDGPRYSSGYASLFNVFAFTIESHMLKPYEPRVNATYQMMRSIIDYSSMHADTIKKLRRLAFNNLLQQHKFPIAWSNDNNKFTEIDFQGYTYKTGMSKVSSLPVKYYDRKEPYQEKIKFYNSYIPAIEIEAPVAYIIGKGWWKVIELLKANHVEMFAFEEEKSMDVEAYQISNYQSGVSPYEGHHPNSKVEIERKNIQMLIHPGDYFIPVQQRAKRFIIETLEPQATDSYFSWNFFDPILIQKEGYSDYAFEEIAAEYLDLHPELKQHLKEKCSTDTSFAGNSAAQLDFVYKHSPYPEPRHNIYPVFRVQTEEYIPMIPVELNSGAEIRIKQDE